MKISGIFIKTEKGLKRKSISKAILIENFGLKNDIYSGPGDRQIILMSKNAAKTVENDKRNGLCFKKFQESIQVDEIKLENYPIGSIFKIDDVEIQISKFGKKCYAECSIIQSKQSCILTTAVVFARVLKGGEIRINSSIKQLK